MSMRTKTPRGSASRRTSRRRERAKASERSRPSWLSFKETYLGQALSDKAQTSSKMPRWKARASASLATISPRRSKMACTPSPSRASAAFSASSRVSPATYRRTRPRARPLMRRSTWGFPATFRTKDR